MAVNLTTLFTRLGRIAGAADSVNAFRGTTDLEASGYDSVGRHVDEIRDEYTTSRTDLVNGLYALRNDYRNVHSAYITGLKTLAQNTLIEMVNDDTELPSKTVEEAFKEIVRQMDNTSDSVDANAPAGSVAAASPPTNTGNPAVVVSVTDEYGKLLEYTYAEIVKLTCSTDSYTGGATARRETYTAKGESAQTDKLMWDWPKGSACNISVTSCDPSENAGTNMLTNSDFEDFTTTNVPDNWTVVTGSAGTTFGEDADEFEGAKTFKFIGNGSELTAIKQLIPASLLAPNTVYAFNFWGKSDGAVVAGVLTVDLIDGANAVIADDASVNNATTFALSGWTSSYVAKNGFFRTPKVLPATGVYIRVWLSTAVTNTEVIYVDELALCEATQLYTAGPYVAVFGGSTNVIAGDAFNITMTNTRGGLQDMALQFFDPPTLTGLPRSRQLPSNTAGGETVADALRSSV